MRAALTLAVAAATLAILSVAPARAVLIEVLPAAQTVDEGDSVEITLAISGLGDLTAPSLSTFELVVTFDDAVLGFVGAVFGDPILGDQLDVLGLGTNITQTTPGTNSVELFELSLDSIADLDTLQAGAFTLATLTFAALDDGTSAVTVSVNSLGDGAGLPLATDLAPGTVTVSPVGLPVPAPATALLLVLGLLTLGARRMRR